MKTVVVLIEVLSLLLATVASSELHGFVRKVDDGVESTNNKDESNWNKFSPSVARRVKRTVIDGVEAEEREFPFFVDWGNCGASLIHEDIILTAAHCLKVPDEVAYVGAWKTQTVTNGTEVFQIQTERIHPKYVYSHHDFDVMVLKLNSSSILNTPIELNSDPNQPRVNENITAMGHGLTESGIPSIELKKVTVPRIDDTDCELRYPGTFSLDSMMCAGFLEKGGKDTCEGDSGGPLVENRVDKQGNRTVQVGITSFGVGCGLPGLPGVYVSISRVKEWIDEEICILSRNPPKRCNTRARFYGRVWFDQNGNGKFDKASERGFLTGVDAEVRLMRITTGPYGKRSWDRVKTRKILNDGTWEIRLKGIRPAQYYVRVVLKNDAYVFGPKINDNHVSAKGKSDILIDVKHGKSFEVNAGVIKQSSRSTTVSPSFAAHINVGGPSFEDIYGTAWIASEKAAYYSSGTPYNVSDSTVISAAASRQSLYRSELYFAQEEIDDSPMVLEVPIPRGDYHVRLHYAEVSRRAQDEATRVFDVFIEGSLVWKDLDIFKEARGGYTALVKEFETTVDDCLLTIEFKYTTGNPKLSAIDVCTITTVDFDTTAIGTPLQSGSFVGDEWLEFGMLLWAYGGASERPRLFDTRNPRPNAECGDSGLGAPNKDCSPPGPGIGAGGAPGEPGENCDELNNVLIIQEENNGGCPNDNRTGGTIVFDFDPMLLGLYEMGFLDTDDGITVEVSHVTGNGVEQTVFELERLGNNSKQLLIMNIENVVQVNVVFEKSGAVTHLKFCHPDKDTATANLAAQTQCGREAFPSDSLHVLQQRCPQSARC